MTKQDVSKSKVAGPCVLLTLHADVYTRDELYDYFLRSFIADVDANAASLCVDEIVVQLRDEYFARWASYSSMLQKNHDDIAAVKRFNEDLEASLHSRGLGGSYDPDLADCDPDFVFGELSDVPKPMVVPLPLPPLASPPSVADLRLVALEMSIAEIRDRLEWLPSVVRYVVVGAEYGPREHHLHYHVVLMFDTAVSDHLDFLADVIRAGLPDASVQVRDVDDFHLAVRYVCKANDFRASDFVVPGRVDPSTITLRRWQRDLFELPNVDRQVICVVDTVGKHGKSFFSRYLESLYQGVTVNQYNSPKEITQHLHNLCVDQMHWITPKKGADYMHNKTIIFDVPRKKGESSQSSLWQAIEEVKNGHLIDTRYQTRYVTCMSPKIVVFVNWFPDFDALSDDRWLIYDISNIDPDDTTTPLSSLLLAPEALSRCGVSLSGTASEFALPADLNALPHVDFVYRYEHGCGRELSDLLEQVLGCTTAIGVRISKYDPNKKNPLIRFWRPLDLANLLNVDYSHTADTVCVGLALQDYASKLRRGRKLSTYDFIEGHLTNYSKLVAEEP